MAQLAILKGLRHGRYGARETDPVVAVARGEVDAVLPFLPKPLKASVELQSRTGMRPTEAPQMRMADMDRSRELWLYRVQQHKNLWRGQPRVEGLGPAAQRILRPPLRLDGGFLFSPRDRMAELKQEKRAARKTPMNPSQRAREARNAKKTRAVGDVYGIDAYRKAIHRACDQAGVAQWSPRRLRHAKGTELARKQGDRDREDRLGAQGR